MTDSDSLLRLRKYLVKSFKKLVFNTTGPFKQGDQTIKEIGPIYQKVAKTTFKSTKRPKYQHQSSI